MANMKQKLITYLWLDNEAEDMVKFYKRVFKDNFKAGNKTYYTTDTPSDKPLGSVMTYEFELFGQIFVALNGGPEFKFNEAISFQIDCVDQKEVDYYWGALSAVPESEICGWLKDKFGISWQIVPKTFSKLIKSDNKEASRRVMEAMLKMKKIIIKDLEKAYAG
jgi:predicted 3-demethylubiquinone-9 3-methyltransferase (glyoxalase superfamily)